MPYDRNEFAAAVRDYAWRARLDGLAIVEDQSMVDYVEDWSKVRSPARARRRRKQGHPQNITIKAVPAQRCYITGHTVFMHPEAAKALRSAVDHGDFLKHEG